MIRNLLFLIILSSLISCEKNITVAIPEASTEIVVEGKIEVDTIPYVLLSHTLPFVGEISTINYGQNSVSGATVIVEDGTTIDTLVQLIPGFGLYVGTTIRGVNGGTYKLTVIAEGKTITSVTTIPHEVLLDSLWWKPDGSKDSLGFAWAHLTDPDTLGNCYQWFAQRINHYTYGDDIGRIKDSVFIAPQGSSFEDKFVNGKGFDFGVQRGSFTFSTKDDDQNDERNYFKRGDTILVKYCSIDRATFEFVRTEDSQVQSNGNPFGSPAPITSNINGGLGIWAGYAQIIDTIFAR